MSIGIGIGISHHRHSGGGGGGGFTPQALGFNLPVLAYYQFEHPYLDVIHGGGVNFVGSNFNVTGTTTTGSTAVTSVSDTTNLRVGMAVSGTGIPGQTVIDQISGSTVTISQKATASGTVTITATFNGVQVPKAYRDANGFPNAMGPGCTAIQVFINSVSSEIQHKLLYTGSAGTITFVPSDVDLGATKSAGQALFTPKGFNNVENAGGTTYFTYTNPGITAWSCRPSTDPGGTTTSLFRSVMGQLKGGGPIRFLHQTTVERNLHPTGLSDPSHNFSYTNLKFPQNGDGNLYEDLLTGTNRNTNSSADWWQHLDGIPHETQIAACTELSSDAWVNIHWNYDGTNASGVFSSSTYLNTIAPLWAAFSASTGKYVYLEMSNEVWNPGYTVMHQCLQEAAALGITAPQRYAQKAKQAFDAFAAAFNAQGCGPANGSANRLVRTLCWQNGGGTTPTDLQAMVTFIGVSNVEALSVAGYYGPNTTTYPHTFTGTGAATDPVIASMYDVTDTTITTQLAAKAVADSNGLRFVRYEGGRGDSFDDQATLNAIDANANGHDAMSYYLNEDRRRIGKTVPLAYHDFCDRLSLFNNGSSFGLIHHTTDTISTLPKALAVQEAIAGQFTMTDVRLPSAAVVYANSPAGTLVGTVSGFLPEATLSMTDASGWFTIDASGNITTTGTAMTSGSHSVSVVQTPNVGVTVINGPTKSTTLSIPVAPALLQDNFNGGTLDASKWVVSTDLIGQSGISSTGMTASVVSNEFQVNWGSGPGANHGNGIRSVNTIDLTQLTRHFVKFTTNSTDGYERHLAIGAAASARIVAQYANGFIKLGWYNASGTFAQIGSAVASTALARPWVRLRYDTAGGGTIYLDTAASTASNPPVETDWTYSGANSLISSITGFSTTCYVGLAAFHTSSGNAGVVLGFDGFNTGT